MVLEPPADAGEPLTLYLVKRLEMVSRALLDEALRPRGVTTLQFTALSVLARHDGLSSAGLARRSFVTPQTMNEMVLWFERRDLVRRERDPRNRRVLRTRLAPEGRRVVAECDAVVAGLESRVHAALTDDERRDLRDLLARSYAALLPPCAPGAEGAASGGNQQDP